MEDPDGFPMVRQRITSCSWSRASDSDSDSGGKSVGDLTILSDKISNLTFPTRGTLPHASGEVHNAAIYATRPCTTGRCGCVDGNKWSDICGERIDDGKGDWRRDGRRGWRVRRAKDLLLVRALLNWMSPRSRTIWVSKCAGRLTLSELQRSLVIWLVVLVLIFLWLPRRKCRRKRHTWSLDPEASFDVTKGPLTGLRSRWPIRISAC